MFARTLVELGKDYELKFYLTELEKLYAATNSPEIAFQMGVIYSRGAFANILLAKSLFEKVATHAQDKNIRIKAKMFLADIYDTQNDVASCRRLIDSIENTDDESLFNLVRVWKAKVLKDENKLKEAAKILEHLIQTNPFEKDWYTYFCANLILGSLRLKEKNKIAAQQIVDTLRNNFKEKNFKTLQIQINELEKKISDSNAMGILTVDESEDILLVSYAKNKVEIEKRSTIGKLIKSFIKNDTLNKTQLIKVIYDRDYAGESDNKLIYYHIHTLRKELEKIGLNSSALEKCTDGYRLVPEIKNVKGEIQI